MLLCHCCSGPIWSQLRERERIQGGTQPSTLVRYPRRASGALRGLRTPARRSTRIIYSNGLHPYNIQHPFNIQHPCNILPSRWTGQALPSSTQVHQRRPAGVPLAEPGRRVPPSVGACDSSLSTSLSTCRPPRALPPSVGCTAAPSARDPMGARDTELEILSSRH